MPHAHSDMMGQPIVNGENVHSQFLDVRDPLPFQFVCHIPI